MWFGVDDIGHYDKTIYKGRPTRQECNVPLLSIIAWLKNLLLFYIYILSDNMIPSSNITDRGALVVNFVIPKYVTDRGAVVRQPKTLMFNF